jgi:hypothetical protein
VRRAYFRDDFVRVAGGLVPVDVEPAGQVRQQLGQLHGISDPAAAPLLLEGVSVTLVRVWQNTTHRLLLCFSTLTLIVDSPM